MTPEERQVRPIDVAPRKLTADEIRTRLEEAKAIRERIRKGLSEVDRLDPRVDIQLSGKTFTLEFDNTALLGVLKACGVNLLDSTANSRALIENPETLPALIFWGIQKHHKGEITQEELNGLIQLRKMLYIADRVGTALDVFYPETKDTDRAEAVEVEGKQALDPLSQRPEDGSDTGPQAES